MNVELKELVSKADRGDTDAQRQLMDMAKEKESAGEYQEAAELFKLAAMAYRIAASRNSTQAAELGSACRWQEKVLQFYRDWIKNYATPVEPRINRFDKDSVSSEVGVFILALRRDEKFRDMVRYLEVELMKHDVEFCTGSMINRHFYYMAIQKEFFKEFMHEIDMRVVLDPLSDEVMRMCRRNDTST